VARPHQSSPPPANLSTRASRPARRSSSPPLPPTFEACAVYAICGQDFVSCCRYRDPRFPVCSAVVPTASSDYRSRSLRFPTVSVVLPSRKRRSQTTTMLTATARRPTERRHRSRTTVPRCRRTRLKRYETRWRRRQKLLWIM